MIELGRISIPKSFQIKTERFTMEKKIRIQVIYDGRIYEYDEGLSALIFDYAVSHKLDVKYGKSVINKYIDLIKSCCHYDCHETPIIDFMNYVANYWDCLCDLENYSEVLDKFYENRSER